MMRILILPLACISLSLIPVNSGFADPASNNAQITGFSAVQGSIVKKKISGSASGSECGQYLRNQSLKSGLNFQGESNEQTLAIGVAKVSAAINSTNYVDSRHVAFREAWLMANAELGRALETAVAAYASNKLNTGHNSKRELPPDQKAASYRAQAAQIKTTEERGQSDLGSAISNGTRLLNAYLADELKKRGHDIEAEQNAKNENNKVKREELLKKAAEAEAEAERLLSSREFKEILAAVAQERMKGIYSRFTSENVDPDGGETLMCVILQYSRRSEKLAEMMASRDFSNIPKLEPDLPLAQQLPNPSSPEGVFKLITSWGLTVLIDENGDVNLVSYGQAGFVDGDENLEIAAKEEAKLRAEGLIRLFINQTVSVLQASDVGQDVKTFSDQMKKTQLTKETNRKFEQESELLRINGMRQILDWSGIHPVNEHGIAGSVVVWNASEASASLNAKKRQNKKIRDTGGILRSNENGADINNEQGQVRGGRLKGSTRSKDF